MWRRCLLLLAGVLLLCALPAVAAAHTELVRADPADGAVLAESPGLAQLWFSGDIAAPAVRRDWSTTAVTPCREPNWCEDPAIHG